MVIVIVIVIVIVLVIVIVIVGVIVCLFFYHLACKNAVGSSDLQEVIA